MMMNTLLGTKSPVAYPSVARIISVDKRSQYWVCRVWGSVCVCVCMLLFVKHTLKTQGRGNHIAHMSLWFGKMSGWLPAAARNDGDSDSASHTLHFSQQFLPPPSPLFKCSKHAVQVCQKN